MCGPHYKRWHAYGDATDLSRLKRRPPSVPLEDWFWSRVHKTDACWLWTAATNDAGYGQLWTGEKVEYVHRLSYEMSNGEIRDGLVVDHWCHVHACVNPAHLTAVTHKQNLENMGANRDAIIGVRGVSRDRRGKLEVRVGHDGVTHRGGRYASLAEAERAAIALRNRLYTNNVLDWQADLEDEREARRNGRAPRVMRPTAPWDDD